MLNFVRCFLVQHNVFLSLLLAFAIPSISFSQTPHDLELPKRIESSRVIGNKHLLEGHKIPDVSLSPMNSRKDLPKNPKDLNTLLKTRGPESGGGGGTVRIAGIPFLVDFFWIPQSFPQIQIWDSQQKSSFMETPSEEPIEIPPRARIDDPAFQNVFHILESWSKLPMDRIADALLGTFQTPLRWIFVDDTLGSLPSFRPPGLMPDFQIQTAANYQILRRDFYLVRIQRHLWNEMPLFHQSGLLLHEAFRQLQLENQKYFNDETLQKATAILMLCRPSIKLSQYVNLLILNFEKEAIERLGSFEEVTATCRGPE